MRFGCQKEFMEPRCRYKRGGGSEDVPKLVMQGYTVLVQEIIDQLAETKYPTHVFVLVELAD